MSPRRPSQAPAVRLEALEVRTLLAGGQLDPTFDGDGIADPVFTGLVGRDTRPEAGARQSDGRLLVGGHVADSSGMQATIHRFQSDGTLDTSFGSGGAARLGDGTVTHVVVASDGRIVFARVSATDGLELGRLNSDGTLDRTFSDDGRVSVSPLAARALGLAVTADGGVIVLQGRTLYRLTSIGVLDNGWGTGGVLSVAPSDPTERVVGFVVQSTGAVVVVGHRIVNSDDRFPFVIRLRRFGERGVTDASFGNGGVAESQSVDGYRESEASTPIILPGDLVLVPLKTVYSILALRFEMNGAFDRAFGEGGVFADYSGDSVHNVRASVIPDGRIVLGATKGSSLPYKRTQILRLTPAGMRDWTFEGGFGTADVGSSTNRLQLIELLARPDGSASIIGESAVPRPNRYSQSPGMQLPDFASEEDHRVFLANLSTEGQSPATYDERESTEFVDHGPGEVRFDFRATSMTSDGRVVVVGFNVLTRAMWIARMTPDGSPDTSFSAGGAVRIDESELVGLDPDSVYSALVQSDGGIVVAFRPNPGVSLVRFDAQGKRDLSFGTNGIVHVNDIQALESALVLSSDDGFLLSGHVAKFAPYGSEGRVLRYRSNGVLDTSFANGGAITVPENIRFGIASVGPRGEILVAAYVHLGTYSNPGRYAVTLFRYLANGNPDNDAGHLGRTEISVQYRPSPDLPPREFYAVNVLSTSPEGRVTVLGFELDTLDIRSYLLRLAPDGSVEFTSSPFDSSITSGFEAVVLPDGSIIQASFERGAIKARRLDSAGAVDNSWGTNGAFLLAENGPATSQSDSMLLQPDFRIVFVGYSPSGGIRAARLLNAPGIYPSVRDILATSESGNSTTFDVRISSQPTAPVTIAVTSSDTTEGTVSVSSLTFTPENWSKPQAVTITGVDDKLFDADQRYRILLGPATSADADYNGMTVRPVEVRNRDDETLRFFRAYNPQANFHFFTTSVSEFQGVQPNGYNDESSGRGGFSLVATAQPGFTPLFRLYNLQKGYHYYTSSAGERDFLLSLNPPSTDPNFGKIGWRFEGSPGFIADTQQAGTNQVFRLYNKTSGAHLFTENPAVRAAVLQSPEWEEHAPLGFAFLVDDAEPLGATANPPPPVAASVPEARSTAAAAREKSMPNVASLVALQSGSRSILPAVPTAADVEGASSSAIGAGDEFDVAALDAYLESLAGELVGSDV